MCVYDLETGAAARRPYPVPGTPVSIALVEHEGASLIVCGASDQVIRVWDTSNDASHAGRPDDASAPSVPDQLGVLAVTDADGHLRAVCSGRSGAVRQVDLSGAAQDRQPGMRLHGAHDRSAGVTQRQSADATVSAVAVAALRDRPVVICARGDAISVLDLASGEDAAPPPPRASRRQIRAIATADLDGRPVGAYAAESVSAWYLDSGQPTGMRLKLPDGSRISAIATGTLGARHVLAVGGSAPELHLADLRTGEAIGDPVSGLGFGATGIGFAELAGKTVLVYSYSGQVRARYADQADEAQLVRNEYASQADFGRQQETPPPPPRLAPLYKAALNRHGTGTDAMAIGVLGGVPVALSSRDNGTIDIFTIETALPVGDPLTGHDGQVAALAFADLGGRPIAASAGYDGTVRLWDLTDASLITAIHTLTGLRGIALYPPDHCIIATEKGLIATRIDLRALAPDRPCVILPHDVRGARRCPAHDGHVQARRSGSVEVIRFCVKGIQLANPKFRPLEYAGGHCYVLQDRIMVTEAGQLDWDLNGMEIPLRRIFTERIDVPHAYEYDGGHFRITIEDMNSHRALCCYRRSEADQLHKLITRK